MGLRGRGGRGQEKGREGVKGPGEEGRARPPQEQGFDCECSEGCRMLGGMWTQTTSLKKETEK